MGSRKPPEQRSLTDMVLQSIHVNRETILLVDDTLNILVTNSSDSFKCAETKHILDIYYMLTLNSKWEKRDV